MSSNISCCPLVVLLIACIALPEGAAFSVTSSRHLTQVARTINHETLQQIGHRTPLINFGTTTHSTTTTHLFSDYLSTLSSGVSIPKKKKTKLPPPPPYEKGTLPDGSPNYCSLLNAALNELSSSNELSTATFSPAGMTYEREGPSSASKWKCSFIDLKASMNIKSAWMTSKKKAKQDASRLYLKYLENIGSQSKAFAESGNQPQAAARTFKKYTVNEFSQPVDDESQLFQDVEAMIEARDVSRYERDFNTADEIRVALWKTNRVAVDDESKSWSVGGDFGPRGTFLWTDDGPINPRKQGKGGGKKAEVKTLKAKGTVEVKTPTSKGDVKITKNKSDGRGPKSKADVTVPKSKAGVKGPKPKAGVTVPKPKADVKGPKSKADVTVPKSKAGVTVPKSKAGVTAPKSKADVKGPKSKADVTVPKSKADINGDDDTARMSRRLEAQNQPKTPEVEAQLQAKYGAIDDLEERAHTICFDLGIV